MDVDVDEGGHEELAVEPVHDATVPRNDVPKILNEMKHSCLIRTTYSKAIFLHEVRQRDSPNLVDCCLTFILNARLKPLAKKPPKGPMTLAKMDMKMAWMKNG